jgi:hypothetical protein
VVVEVVVQLQVVRLVQAAVVLVAITEVARRQQQILVAVAAVLTKTLLVEQAVQDLLQLDMQILFLRRHQQQVAQQ